MCLPEMFSTGFVFDRMEVLAEPVGGVGLEIGLWVRHSLPVLPTDRQARRSCGQDDCHCCRRGLMHSCLAWAARLKRHFPDNHHGHVFVFNIVAVHDVFA